MKFESKYNLGDVVSVITRTSVRLPPERCSACEGEGTCMLRGERYACPKCHGKKETEARGFGWVITDRGTIRNIRAETVRPGIDDDEESGPVLFVYMFTDNGCGTLHPESRLWPTGEAQAECDRRNNAP